MAQTKTPPPVKGKAPFLPGSVIWQRKGPLPVWAWGIIGLALVFIIVWWRRNRAAGEATESATSELPGNQGAPPIFIVPQAATPAVNVPITVQPPATVPTAPPGGGANPPLQIPTHVPVPLETNLYDWIAELNRSYGLNLTFNQMFGKNLNDPSALNVGARKYIRWDTVPGPPGTPKKPVFNRNWSGKNPPLGVPPMRIR